MLFTVLGILSGVILICGDIPYVIDTLKHKTKPHRVTWMVVCLLNIIGFANQFASGASDSLWLFGAAVFVTALISLLSIPYGTGGYAKVDIIAMLGALTGLVLWWLFNSPLASIIANVAVGWVALAPTYIKAYKHPETETKITWLIGSVSALLGALAVGKLNLSLLILPINAFVIQFCLFSIIEFRQRQGVS